jgi:hypothetical protein
MEKNMGLEKEMTWYDENKASLISEHEGKWIAVYGKSMLCIFDTFEEAYNEGIKIAKCEEILVRQIVREELIMEMPSNFAGTLHAPIFF